MTPANSSHPYNTGLDKNAANHTQLSPLSLLARTAYVYPQRAALIHGDVKLTWAEVYARSRQLASALKKHGVGVGDTVATMLPNVPAMNEAHFGVPMIGAVLNTLNTRLDAEAIAFMLDHGEAKVLLTDREFSGTLEKALTRVKNKPLVSDVDDVMYSGGKTLGAIEYEAFIAGGENISSLEVEDALYRHPAVMAAAVVAKPDAKWGEVPCAFIELKDGAQPSEQEIIDHCRARLAHFKAPKQVVFGVLPKTSTGKIQKFVLREQVKSASAIDG